MNAKKIPNLFVVGSAKAGTTFLYEALKSHPDCYVPNDIKELNFMAFGGEPFEISGPGDSENAVARGAKSENEYLLNYHNWRNETIAADVSPSYLYYKGTAERIYHYKPDAKIIAILRNPVDCAFSMYSMMRRDGRESEKNFLKAFNLSEKRRDANWEYAWDYKNGFSFDLQIQQYLDIFPQENILIVRYEELQNDASKFMLKICDFLKIREITINHIKRTNQKPTRYQIFRNNKYHAFTFDLLKKFSRLFPRSLKKFLFAKYLNTPALRLTRNERFFATTHYLPVIEELEKKLNWDLTAWKA